MVLLKASLHPKRGIRQGDPMSPFLFILAMEGLNNMIRTAKYNGWISGFEVAKNNEGSLEVTHLQYADDTLFFARPRKKK